MDKKIETYIIIGLVSTIIILILTSHFIGIIFKLVQDYNRLVSLVNTNYNTTYSKKEIIFFGTSYNPPGFLGDLLLVIIIILLCVVVFLRIYWSEKG